MKFKTTAKEIRQNGGRVVSAGYCDLQHLLYYTEPVAYTCGVYGWNFDVYQVNGLTICTGYRGMVGRRANNIREYDERAEKIVYRTKADNQTWSEFNEQRSADLEALLKEFCEQA